MFAPFPKIGYSFDLSERGKITAVTNIFTRFKIKENVLNNAYALYKYQYEENDTPEIVSYKEYGDPQYHWIISGVNEILDPLRVFVSDKEFVKLYIKSNVGDQYNVPTIAILKNTREVDSYNFPANCCIKPTHACGRIILRKNAEVINKEIINQWFSLNFYMTSGEKNYKHLKPKIIVEPLIFDSVEVEDYKFFCFKGKAHFIQLDVNRHTDHRRAIFDTNWNLQNFTILHPKPDLTTTIKKPNNLEEMIKVAEKLSSKFEFIRVDLYSNGEKCLVGEITNCHGAAAERFIPPESELEVSKFFFS